MKKAIVLALGLMVGSSAFAASVKVCVNGAPQGTASGNVTLYSTVASMFVVSSFPLKCSANVEASKDENAIAFSIGSLSLKGKSVFEGSSGGGAIKAARVCTGQCAAGQEATNLAQLLIDATP
jgi:hypothetical protein